VRLRLGRGGQQQVPVEVEALGGRRQRSRRPQLLDQPAAQPHVDDLPGGESGPGEQQAFLADPPVAAEQLHLLVEGAIVRAVSGQRERAAASGRAVVATLLADQGE
jgi:hypothetical protein